MTMATPPEKCEVVMWLFQKQWYYLWRTLPWEQFRWISWKQSAADQYSSISELISSRSRLQGIPQQFQCKKPLFISKNWTRNYVSKFYLRPSAWFGAVIRGICFFVVSQTLPVASALKDGTGDGNTDSMQSMHSSYGSERERSPVLWLCGALCTTAPQEMECHSPWLGSGGIGVPAAGCTCGPLKDRCTAILFFCKLRQRACRKVLWGHLHFFPGCLRWCSPSASHLNKTTFLREGHSLFCFAESIFSWTFNMIISLSSC